MKIPSFLLETINLDNIDDIYNRDYIVNDLYNIIKDNEKSGGIKIGLYGKWGSGKTTILKKLKEKFKKEYKNKLVLKRYKVVFLKIPNVNSIEEVYKYFLEDIKEGLGFIKDITYFSFKNTLIISIFIIGIAFFISFIISFYQSFYVSFNFTFDELLNSKNIFGTLLGIFLTTVIGGVIKYIFSKNFISNLSHNIDAFFLTLYLLFKKFVGKKTIIIVDDLDRLKPEFLPDILLWLSGISQVDKGIICTN